MTSETLPGGTLLQANGGRTLPPGDEQRRLRVLLVDGQDLIHWGFKMLLAAESWVERFVAAHTAAQALELARRYQPHVAVIDLQLSGESGAELCERIRESSRGTRVLLMSGVDRVSAHSARAVGASGFVPKAWGARDIAGAARMVGLGMTVFAPEAEQPPSLLTDREREVLGMIASGSTNREIAEQLYLSPHTVKDHTSALYRKMKARNRAEAILRAQRLGLLT
ncbi:MAG TPA: response regulator transcription factor [Thermoleophilaceae bacterium]